jgi:hypothetical protein
MAKKQATQEKVPQTSETQHGNLNQHEQGEPALSQGCYGTKSNGETATLRSGNLPKAEAVTTVDRDKNKGAAIKCADRQNHMDEKYGLEGLNVVPAGRNRPAGTGSGQTNA